MKLQQSGDKIIITELNPMCDAPNNGTFLVLTKETCRTTNGEVWEVYKTNIEKFASIDAGNIFEAPELHGWLPMPIYDPLHKQLHDFKLWHERYEKLRKLNAQQYSELYQRNLAGENFDEMVDEL